VDVLLIMHRRHAHQVSMHATTSYQSGWAYPYAGTKIGEKTTDSVFVLVTGDRVACILHRYSRTDTQVPNDSEWKKCSEIIPNRSEQS
jgi:hypothetical protein